MQNDDDQIDYNVARADLILFERALTALYGYDCRTLAAELVKKFGSVSGVLCATVRELEATPGVTYRAAALISLSTPVLRQALYRSNYAVDCERGLAVETCIEYIERPYPFKLCIFTDECGRLVHIEKLDGQNDVRAAISGGARHDARHFALAEFSPNIAAAMKKTLPDLKDMITNLGKLGILFIDHIGFDGLLYRSAVRDANGEPPFDITGARTFRYVCDKVTVNKILSKAF